MESTTKAPGYMVQSVVRACDILKCCRQATGPLSLDHICKLTQLSRPTAFRMLATLVQCDMLEKIGKNAYRLRDPTGKRKRYRFGYASQSEEFSFSRLVSESIRSAAYQAGIDLLVVSNRYSSTIAIRNAEMFVQEHVDLVIEFQTNEQSASIIASKLVEANIPMIAIEVPHPGAAYYGADNYRAGVIGGRALAKACMQQWSGQVDEVLLLELPMAGPLPRSRMTGMIAGIRELIPKLPDHATKFLDGKGRFESSLSIVRNHLAKSRAKRILVGAMNDPSCLGALHAFAETGRSEHCLAVGQNASIESRREMRRAGSRLLGSVAYFPEQYGEAVLALAIDKMRGREIPLASFVQHKMITAENVDMMYPNDGQIQGGDADSLLFSRH